MESLGPHAEVRLAVAQCFRTLTTSTDNKDIVIALQELHYYLDEGPESRTTSVQRAEFKRAHFTRTLQFLISNIQADWFPSLTAAQRTALWDGLFLGGPPEQALLVLMEGIGELRWVVLGRGLEVSPSFCLFINCLSTTEPAQIWTTWSASLRGSFRVVDSLTCCGPTAWRQGLLTPPSSERFCWDVLWHCQTSPPTGYIQTTSLFFFLSSTTLYWPQRCSLPWSGPAKHLKAREHLLNEECIGVGIKICISNPIY